MVKGLPQNINIAELQQQYNAKGKEGFPILQNYSSSDEDQPGNLKPVVYKNDQTAFLHNRMMLSQQQLQQYGVISSQIPHSQGNSIALQNRLTPVSMQTNSLVQGMAPSSSQTSTSLAQIMSLQTTQANINSQRMSTAAQVTPVPTPNSVSTAASNVPKPVQQSSETEATVYKLTTPGAGNESGESFFVEFKDYGHLREEKNRLAQKNQELEEGFKQVHQLNASFQKENAALTAESREKLGIALNEVKKAYEVEKALKVEKNNVQVELENSKRINQSLNDQMSVGSGRNSVPNPQSQPGYAELFSANQNRLAEIAQLHQVIEQLNQQLGEMQKKVFEQDEKIKDVDNENKMRGNDEGTMIGYRERYQEMVQANQTNVAKLSQMNLVIDRITRENEMWSKKVKEVDEKSKKIDENSKQSKADVETKKKLETALNEVRVLALEKSKLQTILSGIKKSNSVTLNSMSVKIQNLKESNKVLHEINTTIKKEKETLTEKCTKQEKYLKKFQKANDTGKAFKFPDEKQESPKELEQSKKVIRTLNKQLADLLKKNFDLGVKIKELEKKGGQESKPEEKIDPESYFREKSKDADEDMKTLEDRIAEEIEKGQNEEEATVSQSETKKENLQPKIDEGKEDTDEEMANFDDEGISIDPITGEIINSKETATSNVDKDEQKEPSSKEENSEET